MIIKVVNQFDLCMEISYYIGLGVMVNKQQKSPATYLFVSDYL